MSRIVHAVARVGDVADSVVRAGRALPSQVRLAWSTRPYRRAGLAAGAAILLLYLTAIGDINAWGRPSRPDVDVAADWVAKLTATRAPYLFEPVAAISPTPWLSVFVSPGNLLLGALLATLFALNVAVSSHQVFAMRACRHTALGRLFAVLPALGAGMACCAPTLLLALGTGFAAALAPVFLPLRSWLFPVSVLLMLATLVWATARSPSAEPSPPSQPRPRTAE